MPASVPTHSAAVYRYAVELVEDTRRGNDARLADARDLAAVVRIADEPAADRILSAAEEACARDLHIAEQQAEEVVRHARAGIMAAVQRYAQSLIEEARAAGQSRLDKATELAELVRLADASSADRLLQAIHTVNDASMRTAERQAHGVLETAQTRLNALPSRVGGDNQPATAPAPPAEGGESFQTESFQRQSAPPGFPGPGEGESAPEPAPVTASSQGEPAVDADPQGQPASAPYLPPMSNGNPAPAEQRTEEPDLGYRPEGS